MLLLHALAAPAFAASWDPDLTWRTLHTEHFRITFHDGEDTIAAEVAIVAEDAWTRLTVELDHTPTRPIDVVLVDWTDQPNGMAQTVPQNLITIYVTNPSGESVLGLYEDWNEAIFTHELTHILHIDTVEGIPKVGRWIFGSLISTHQVAPLWTLEGYATFEETRYTTGGRGRHAGADMIKRASVLEHRFPPLGNLDGFQALPPSGNLRYLFGQDFMQFIADSRGEDKWREWVHRYGSSVPFVLPAKRTFGANFVTMYREWRTELTRRYEEQAAAVRAEGETILQPVTALGLSCGPPAYNPATGELWASCSDPRRGTSIWRFPEDGSAPVAEVKRKYADDIRWRADGTAFLYSSTHTEDLYTFVDDVFLYDLGKKSSVALTDGKRARDATFSPDGSRILCVTNALQNNQLAELAIDQQLVPLTDHTDKSQLGAPAFAPDGSMVAISRWTAGQRDLWLYTPAGKPWRRLTWDGALDIQPAWSPDGRVLYFTSDRNGIPNIYAIELASEHLFRVTNAVLGAYAASPSPDGSRIAVNTYSAQGPRVATFVVDRTTWKNLGVLPTFDALAPSLTESPPPELALRNVEKPVAPPPVEPVDPRITPYNPLPSLAPPRFWVPGTLLTTTGESFGLYLSAYTGGQDILRRYIYSGYATYRTDADFVGGGGSFVVNRWRPIFGGSLSTYVSPYGTISTLTPVPEDGGAWIPGIQRTEQRYWDHRIRASLSGSYPLSENSGLSGSWRGEYREPKDPLPDDVYFATLPTRGFFSTLAVGWSTGKAESYALSISPERARSLGLGVEYTPWWLGSWNYDNVNTPQPFDQLQLNGEWREYIPAPWLPNHVFAWKASGGLSVGSTFNYGSFRLGGSFSENGITVIPQEWRSLRGFYTGTRDGETYWLTSGEYRFPIWQVDRGVGTVPLFIRNVSGAVLVDAGNAWDDPADAALSNSLVGVGAELRVSAIAFYGLNLYGRVGYAFSALGGGIAPGDIDGLYFQAGSSF